MVELAQVAPPAAPSAAKKRNYRTGPCAYRGTGELWDHKDRFLAWMVATGYSPVTIKAAHADLSWLFRWLDAKEISRIADITPEAARGWAENREVFVFHHRKSRGSHVSSLASRLGLDFRQSGAKLSQAGESASRSPQGVAEIPIGRWPRLTVTLPESVAPAPFLPHVAPTAKASYPGPLTELDSGPRKKVLGVWPRSTCVGGEEPGRPRAVPGLSRRAQLVAFAGPIGFLDVVDGAWARSLDHDCAKNVDRSRGYSWVLGRFGQGGIDPRKVSKSGTVWPGLVGLLPHRFLDKSDATPLESLKVWHSHPGSIGGRVAQRAACSLYPSPDATALENQHV